MATLPFFRKGLGSDEGVVVDARAGLRTIQKRRILFHNGIIELWERNTMGNVTDIRLAKSKRDKPKPVAGYIYSSEDDMEQARILLNVAGDKSPSGSDLALTTIQITQTRLLRAILESQNFGKSELELSEIVYTGS